ncbi:hypothetical protein HHUSO_G31577, partial [Huso huso]
SLSSVPVKLSNQALEAQPRQPPSTKVTLSKPGRLFIFSILSYFQFPLGGMELPSQDWRLVGLCEGSSLGAKGGPREILPPRSLCSCPVKLIRKQIMGGLHAQLFFELLLIISAIHLSLSDDHRYYTSEGRSVSLPCGGVESSAGSVVEWVQTQIGHVTANTILTRHPDGRVSKGIKDTGGRFELQTDSSLTIHRAVPEDAGSYQCNGNRASELLFLTVFSDPKDPMPGELVIVTCELKCAVNCGSYTLRMNAEGQSHTSQDAPLQMVFNVNKSDDGEIFRCRLDEAGRGRAEASFQLQVKEDHSARTKVIGTDPAHAGAGHLNLSLDQDHVQIAE